MRCPHCAGEIQDESLFCGICGKSTAGAGTAASAGASQSARRSSAPRQAEATSPSLFELPVSRGARVARIAIVLALDALLLIAGIAMIVSYLNDRDRGGAKHQQRPPADATADAEARSVKFAEPVPLHKQAPPPALVDGDASPPRARSKRSRKRRAKRPLARRNPDRRDAGTTEPAATTTDAAIVASAPVVDAGRASSSDAGVDRTTPSDADVAILARQIRLVVNRERRLLQRCYNQVAKATTVDKALQGRVEIRFEVMPDGKTMKVVPRGNTTGSTQLALCVANLIRNWKFPSHTGKRSIPFVWPFDFRGS